MHTQNSQSEINVGVDTGKYQLDLYLRPLDLYFTVSNDQKGIKEAIDRIKKHSPTRIVIEATGWLYYDFIAACGKAKLPFCVVNSLRMRRFAQAIGQLAKMDLGQLH
jgi:transposase